MVKRKGDFGSVDLWLLMAHGRGQHRINVRWGYIGIRESIFARSDIRPTSDLLVLCRVSHQPIRRRFLVALEIMLVFETTFGFWIIWTK